MEHALENVSTRRDAYRYLLAASVCLAEAANALRDECGALRGATYQHNAWLALSLQLCALSGLLANHTIAISWPIHHRDR